MDVTSAMKVNELTQELLKKGIASNSEEASAMAEKFLQKKMVHANDSPSERMDDNGKYEVLVERMQRKVNNEFSSLHEKVTALTNQVEVLRNEINCLKRGASNIVKEREEVKKEPIRQERLNTSNENKEPQNQRIGNLKPGDVKIESFFYCGTKK